MDTQSKNKDNPTGIFESVINAKDSEAFHEFKKTLPKRYADNIDTLKVVPSEALKKLSLFDLLNMEIHEFKKNLMGFHRLAVILQSSSTGADTIALLNSVLDSSEHMKSEERMIHAQAVILAMLIIDFSVIMTDNAWFVQETERILKENDGDDHE